MKKYGGVKIGSASLAYGAMFAALVTVSTMIIKMPIPVTGGYIHPGDGLVLLSGICLGPVGALAAGVGSALADLLSGYVVYMPATLIIKGLSAWICAVMWRQLEEGLFGKGFPIFGKGSSRKVGQALAVLLAGSAAEMWMVAGYFLFECLLYNPETASAAVLFNGIQGLFGVVIAIVLAPLLPKIQ